MEISSKYSPQDTEVKWYQHWLDKNYFHSTPDEREPYTTAHPRRTGKTNGSHQEGGGGLSPRG